ncbi:MAG: cardiolipin synthase [Paludibacteraceae bacterium]|nr:cardiolipin synthase [Paludibacteraceae bacterium]
MKTSHLIIIIICTIAVIGAIVCDIVRRKQYKPSAQLNELKQPLSPEHATQGNGIETYTNISQLIPSLLRDIDCAKEYVLFQFFKFEKDSLGMVVREALIKIANEGVPVLVIYDAFPGSIVKHSFFREMQRAGVKVHRYNPVLPIPSAYSNNRNHRKIVVIDGHIGYMGGMNIAERYLKGVHNGDWRDTHLRIEGAVCQQLQQVFMDDWRKLSSATDIDLPTLYLDRADTASVTPMQLTEGKELMQSAVQIIASDPEDSMPPILQAMIEMADAAKQYLYIQSPYLLPPKPLQEALCEAAKRGIDVRLMIPKRGDRSIFISYASRSYLKPLLAAGVKIYFHTFGFIHAKAWVADDKIATVGSSNIDFRSFTQSSEVNAFVYDTIFAQQMRQIFEQDMRHCDMIPQDWWQQRSCKERILQLLVKPFVYLM